MRVINNDTQEVAIKIIEINTETISTKASLLKIPTCTVIKGIKCCFFI